MRSSRGFASTAPNLCALFRLAFASAPRQRRLTLLVTVSRRIIMQKARRHPGLGSRRNPVSRAPTACRHVVSGSLSSPGRGSSHLSLALLCAIGRQRVFSLAGWAPPIRTAFHVRGLTQVPNHHPSPAAYGAFTRCGPPFQMVPLEYKVDYVWSYNPTRTSPSGLGCSAFARRY